MSTNCRQHVGLGTRPGRGEQGEQALLHLAPSLLVLSITTVWRRCNSCRVPFAWRNTASICPVICLSSHEEHGGEALLIFLTEPGRNELLVRRVVAAKRIRAALDTPEKGRRGLEDNFPTDQRLISWAEGKLRTTQMKRKEWICALITDDRVGCLAALWTQFINIRLETNPKRADCTVTGLHKRDDGGETWQREGKKQP